MTSHDRHLQRILDKVENDSTVSQRFLASELGIALGLTNLLLRKIVRNGWVRLVRLRPNRVLYQITPAGLKAKARLYRALLADNLQFYKETRDRIQETLTELSQNWPDRYDNGGASEQRIVLYGAGEVAEIGFLCMQHSTLKLVGVIDDCPQPAFFGLPVHSLDHLEGKSVNGVPFDQLLIMSFNDVDSIREQLIARGVPPEALHGV